MIRSTVRRGRDLCSVAVFSSRAVGAAVVVDHPALLLSVGRNFVRLSAPLVGRFPVFCGLYYGSDNVLRANELVIQR